MPTNTKALQVAEPAGIVAGKNAIINGGFDIWQRGTSVALAASTQRANGFGPDRWQMETGTNQATTVSRQTVSDTTNLPNIQYAVRVQRNSGQTGTGTQYFTQTLETANSIPYAGRIVTFSFYARAGANYSATSNALVPNLWSNNTTDGNIWNGGWNAISAPTITLTTTWQRFTVTGTIGATQTQVAVGFQWTPTGTAGANDYFEVTGVQLELGNTATPFSRAGGNIQGELAACQRYYERYDVSTASNLMYAGGFASSTTNVQLAVPCLVPKRVAPTSIDYANLAWANGSSSANITAATINSANIFSTFINGTTTGVTAGNGYMLANRGSGTAYIGLNSEL